MTVYACVVHSIYLLELRVLYLHYEVPTEARSWNKQVRVMKSIFLSVFHFLSRYLLLFTSRKNLIIQNSIFFQGSSFTKIRPQAKKDNFAFKNSNIIIEGLIWKIKDYFS